MTDAALAAPVAAESVAPAPRASLGLPGSVRAAVARVLGFAEWLAAMLLVEAVVLLVALAVSAVI